MVILNWGKMFLVICDTWFYPSMIIGPRRRFHVNFFTCGAEQSPLDCILLKEGASAPQETAHTWTNNITMLPACFCSETAQKHIWQGRLCHHGNKGPSVYWVRAVDKSAQGTTHVPLSCLTTLDNMLPCRVQTNLPRAGFIGHMWPPCLFLP